jgi:hypothetical protein
VEESCLRRKREKSNESIESEKKDVNDCGENIMKGIL